MKTWVKFYTKALDSPDIGALSWAHRGIFNALILLAGRLDYRDDEDQETGQLDTLERTAWRIRCDVDEFREAVSAFTVRGMVAEHDDLLFVTNYYKHQRRAPSAQRDAVKERVQRHRENKAEECNEDVTTLQDAVTLLDKSRVDTDKSRVDTEEKRESGATAPPFPSPPKKSSNSLPIQAQAFLESGGKFRPGKLKGGQTKKQAAIEFMIEKIPDHPDDLIFWGQVVDGYCRQWSSYSYTTMVNEYYLKRRIPGQSSGDGNAARSAYRTADEYPEGDEVL